MNDSDRLYTEVKGDLQKVIDPLFPFAMQCLNKTGGFLPFGSIINTEGKVELIATHDGKDMTSSKEILPLLHTSLRDKAQLGASVVAVCEWVTIERESTGRTQAIKALVEHSRGLTTAFYLPVHKPLFRSWQAGVMFVKPAAPEIGAWESH